jgi:HSP20 family protein
MKRMVIALFLLVSVTGLCYAVVPDEDAQESLDMQKVREKIVRTKREFDKLMKDVLSTYSDKEGALLAGFGQDVKVDVLDSGKNMIVKADLPGMEKDKIDITLENGKFLKISGSREIMKSQTAPGMVRQERSIGKFERVVELPYEGMSQGLMASYKDGVLEIVIPKKAPAKEETVKIKVM